MNRLSQAYIYYYYYCLLLFRQNIKHRDHRELIVATYSGLWTPDSGTLTLICISSFTTD